MKSRTERVFSIVLALMLLVILTTKVSARPANPPEKPAPSQGRGSPANRLQLAQNYGKLPLSFEINQGQTDAQVKFLSRGSGYTLFLTGTEAVLWLKKPSAVRHQLSAGHPLRATTDNLFPPLIQNPKSQIQNPPVPSPENLAPDVVRLKLVGGNASAKVVGLDPLPGKSNYFIGNDPRKWRTNVPSYRKVKYENVYPGIDLVYYGNQRQLEYDFVVAPGADPHSLVLSVDGAQKVEIEGQGNLVLRADGGDVRLHKPIVYQPVAPPFRAAQANAGLKPGATSDAFNRQSSTGNRQLLDGRYVLLASNRIGFEVGAYDRTKPLVIDPTLSYATYLGGSDFDTPQGIAVDFAGNAYVVGITASSDFPADRPWNAPHGGGDVFVTKLNAAGSDLVCSAYLGGSGGDNGRGIAVDATGDIYVTGDTNSSDFPITPRVLKETLTGSNAFVTKIDTSCSTLAYSTFLGGSKTAGGAGGNDVGLAIAVDSAGKAYVSGVTYSLDFPTTSRAFDKTYGGNEDLFVAKLNPPASSLLYSTYLGGSGNDYLYGGHLLALDSSGNIYVVGYTTSSDFPTTPNAFDTTYNPGGVCEWGECALDAFFAKIDPAKTGAASLVYSTYIGGSRGDIAAGVAVDASGKAYVAGFTDSADFPTTANAFQSVYGGKNCGTYPNWCADAILMKIDPTKQGAASLLYSTYLGGSLDEGALDIALNAAGSIYLMGRTYSDDFPLASPTQATLGGGTCMDEGLEKAYPCFDVFVTKFNSSGTALIFSTFLGGDNDEGWVGLGGIAVDSSGNAYVAGGASGVTFPTTPGAFQEHSTSTCADFPPGYVPFVQWQGPWQSPGTQWDANRNMVILGQMTRESYHALMALPLPSSPGQKYCEGVPVAAQDSSSYYTFPLYVPTADERNGDFSWFQGQIYDPVTGLPLPGNVIPLERIPGLMGWRAANSAGGGDAFVAKFTGLMLPVAHVVPETGLLEFGSVEVGSTSNTKTVTLANVGDAALNISAITPTGDFAVATRRTTCSTSAAVEPGTSCTLKITFTPTESGTRDGALTIYDNAGDGTQVISLSGTGTAPAADLAVSMADQPDPVRVGKTVNYLITIQNGGPATATNVVVTNTLSTSSNLGYGRISVPKGCSSDRSGTSVTCSLGSLLPGATRTLTMSYSYSVPCTITSTATASATQLDPDMANNSVTATTSVISK